MESWRRKGKVTVGTPGEKGRTTNFTIIPLHQERVSDKKEILQVEE